MLADCERTLPGLLPGMRRTWMAGPEMGPLTSWTAALKHGRGALKDRRVIELVEFERACRLAVRLATMT